MPTFCPTPLINLAPNNQGSSCARSWNCRVRGAYVVDHVVPRRRTRIVARGEGTSPRTAEVFPGPPSRLEITRRDRRARTTLGGGRSSGCAIALRLHNTRQASGCVGEAEEGAQAGMRVGYGGVAHAGGKPPGAGSSFCGSAYEHRHSADVHVPCSRGITSGITRDKTEIDMR